jgi:uncharacterized ion transporter superfamily protein YfcC
MTLNKEKTINIPIWLVSIFIPILMAVSTTYIINREKFSRIQINTEMNNKQIEDLRKEKVNRDEFQLVLQQLDRIEHKLETKLDKK